MSRKIRENLIALCTSGAVQAPADLQACFGAHSAEMAYLLRLYKDSFFYNGEFRIDMRTEGANSDDAADKTLREIFDIDDETLAALRTWLSERWENGEQPTYDQIGKWIYDYVNNEREKPQ